MVKHIPTHECVWPFSGVCNVEMCNIICISRFYTLSTGAKRLSEQLNFQNT